MRSTEEGAGRSGPEEGQFGDHRLYDSGYGMTVLRPEEIFASSTNRELS
jgi:hypothetical protein